MIEIGPRIDLKLEKIFRGFFRGEVLYKSKEVNRFWGRKLKEKQDKEKSWRKRIKKEVGGAGAEGEDILDDFFN